MEKLKRKKHKEIQRRIKEKKQGNGRGLVG